MPKIVAQPDRSSSSIYGENTNMAIDAQKARTTQFCMWADAQDFSPTEFLLPQIRTETKIEPFRFERRFAASNMTPPSAAELATQWPWWYAIEFGPVSTIEARAPDEWLYHRYRASNLVGLAASIAGEHRSKLSVTDVACHCGVFALEFAEHGFGRVHGVDLRDHNIRQARFLAEKFAIPNVTFEVGNARAVRELEPADIMFCAGLLYHVTFPIELLSSIYDRAKEFAIIDTIAQKHPFSGFHLICGKDVGSTIEGETSHEFSPTYRGMIDALHAAGFPEVYEIIGDQAEKVPLYNTNNVRSFLAVKNPNGLFAEFRKRLD